MEEEGNEEAREKGKRERRGKRRRCMIVGLHL
jgi:hypothetical protein